MEPQDWQLYVLSYAPPARGPVPVAVFAFSPVSDELYWRFRDDWQACADPSDLEYLASLSAEFAQLAAALSARGLIEWMLDSFSNILLISHLPPVSDLGQDPARGTERLLQQLISK